MYRPCDNCHNKKYDAVKCPDICEFGLLKSLDLSGDKNMVVHYQNVAGDEKFFKNVVHIQNSEDGKFLILFDNNKELTLNVSGIESIWKGGV